MSNTERREKNIVNHDRQRGREVKTEVGGKSEESVHKENIGLEVN